MIETGPSPDTFGEDVDSYISPPADAYERGRRFGADHRSRIETSVNAYWGLFEAAAGRPFECEDYAAACLNATASWAPELAGEIQGIADGAGLPVTRIAALNARTEILARAARLAGTARSQECSAVVTVPPAAPAVVGIQHWDWYPDFADNWFVWTVEHGDGTVTRTMTEYGVVGKIGVGRHGFGLLFTILHHSADGTRPGVPVHVIARHVLDRARNVTDAATIIGRAPACASSSLTLFGHEDGDGVAISCEVSPHGTGYVLPEESGLLVHTNHFLADVRGGDDTGVGQTPDTVLRWHTVRRRLAGPCAAGRAGLPELRSALASHAGGSGALCCHPDPADQPLDRYETLATIAIDPSRGQLDVRRGGCCSDREP